MWKNQPKPKIFITNSNVINASGSNLSETIAALYAGRSALDRYGDVGLVGRLRSSDEERVEELASDPQLKDYDRTTRLAVLAARALGSDIQDTTRCGVIVGSSRGNTQKLEQEHAKFLAGKKIDISTSPATTMGSVAAGVARDLNLSGPQVAVSSACSTSLQSVVLASGLLRGDIADAVVAGGVEYATTPFTLAMLKRIRIYHRNEDLPYAPFHSERGGMVLGDGAVMHLMQTDAANARAEILGVGASGEASSMTGLSKGGDALVAACERALADAGLYASDVAAVVAHGAGTWQGDAAEIRAYQRLFGEDLPPITADKWCYGHTLGAASGTALALGVEISRTGMLPKIPSNEFLSSDKKIASGGRVLVTALGFGGGAAAVVLQARYTTLKLHAT